MDNLLALVLDAHGGQDRWSSVSALTAHLSFGGLVFPTRRRIYSRNPDGTADLSRANLTIDIHDIAVQ